MDSSSFSNTYEHEIIYPNTCLMWTRSTYTHPIGLSILRTWEARASLHVSIMSRLQLEANSCERFPTKKSRDLEGTVRNASDP